jgi:GTP-binding protein EngB required for normal cell division
MIGVRRPRPSPPVAPSTEREPGQHLRPEVALVHLTSAVDAANTLGISTHEADVIRSRAEARLGYPSDTYVLALVGGTGVGKSSLLNALAGEPVSAASARRPTTDTAVAWVPHESMPDLESLLGWLAVSEVHEHGDGAIGGVAILDLPDIDSIDETHRERVEALLPKVDAVVWVTDPEKYHDALLHDDFLRQWIPRLDRQAVVLNKADRLTPAEINRIRIDLEHDLETTFAVAGRRPPPVLVTSALDGAPQLDELRHWVGGQVEAKRVVRDRVVATVDELILRLAREAGVDPTRPEVPFLAPPTRRAAIQAVTFAVLRAVGLPALERQAIAATRARARSRGTGPIGLITRALYRLSGRQAQLADPERYLRNWREHGPLAPAVDAVRRALTAPIRNAAPPVRPVLAATVEPVALERRLAAAVDRAIARQDRTVPSSRVWPLLGLGQTLATVAVVLSVGWIALWVLTRTPVESVVLPLLGPLPMPFLTLVLALAIGYLFARLLGWHARWLGRRWASRLRAEVTDAVEREMTGHAFESLDALEDARLALWTTARQVVPLVLR